MNDSLKRKLAFFRDCLEAESRSQTIWSFPTSKSEAINKVETIQPQLTVARDYFDDVSRVLEFYTREKNLLASVFFVEGRHAVPSFAGSSRKKQISCPLFIFPCELQSNDLVSLDLSNGLMNPALEQIFESYGDHASSLKEAVDEILALLAAKQGSSELAERIHSFGEQLAQLTQGELSFSNDAYLSIEPKRASARGSLYELENLLHKRRFSAPLRATLGEMTGLSPKPRSSSFWHSIFKWRFFSAPQIPLPEVLSEAQVAVLDAATDYPLSVVSGPPGTGKSFTIACMALKEFSKGKSVLVVSQNQHAADVVRRKLIDRMGIEPGLTVLASEQGVSREAKQQIKGMLSRSYLNNRAQLKKLTRDVLQLIDRRDALEADYSMHIGGLNEAAEKKWKKGFWSFAKFRPEHSDNLLFEKFLSLETLEREIREAVINLFRLRYEETARQLSRNGKSKQSLKAFADSLTARSEHYQERYYSKVNFDHVLKAVPLWFSSVGNLNRLLPMQREMFDLLIIDEATQCNMSVCLPALQRARRVVIVGDQKQLKHVSFVSYELQRRLAKKHKIDTSSIDDDFRNTSVLDYALAACELPEQSMLLDEHFRSHPQIIQFSNSEFYQNSLKIMTERPNNRQRSIDTVEVKGKRLNKGVNKQEAAAIISKLDQIISEQRHLPETDVHTIGVLAFFSKQADYLEKHVFDKISLQDMRRHNIRIGNPFSFQGEERDHMLISCSVDSTTSGGSYTYLNRDDVFNVAITRARDFQTLFVSCKPEELRSGSKLADYLKYVEQYSAQSQSGESIAHDAFQAEICDWLSKRGVESFKNYRVAGINIDIMAIYHGHAVAIDLIGFEGALSGSLPLNQFRLLQRAGLESFLMPYREWREQKEAVLQALMLRLGAYHKTDQATLAVEKYPEALENAFRAIADGLSINQLNARFLRNEEVMASEQLATLIERYDRFDSLLRANFLPQELTYKRYLNAMHEVLKVCMQNLQQASIAAELATSMFEQQKNLIGSAALLESDTDNIRSVTGEFDDVIAARMSMVDEQRMKFKALIAKNEHALLQIDKTLIMLANVSDAESDQDIDPISALQELTARLELYRGATIDSNPN